jgi:hypothetical protein
MPKAFSHRSVQAVTDVSGKIITCRILDYEKHGMGKRGEGVFI